MLKSNKGYSLVEIGVGIIILTVFLICSVSLFNGCYTAYRTIQQRNIAITEAVSCMEKLLQTDSDILTGFFTETIEGGKYVLDINTDFYNFVEENFNNYKERYAYKNKVDVTTVPESISDEDLRDYIMQDKDYLINDFIKNSVNQEIGSQGYNEFYETEGKNGNYVFLQSLGDIIYSDDSLKPTDTSFNKNNNVYERGNLAILKAQNAQVVESKDLDDVATLSTPIATKITVQRLPWGETDTDGVGVVFGNKVLKLKVEVFYTQKVNYNGLKQKDVRSIVLETVKVADTTQLTLPSTNPAS